MLLQIISPLARKDIDPDYFEVPDNPATRQPHRERARRALDAMFPEGIPDAATIPNKLLAKQVNDWLEARKQPPVRLRTIQRAAGRR
jgi:hypothetical protein